MQTEPHLNFEDISLRGNDEDEFRYSNMSTPTLTSDVSSLRSSLSSFSSPVLAQGPFSARAVDAPLVRKLSLPDNTSMASLSRIPVQRRTHKQRESDFAGDTDDFWPTDAVMFNVPMTPALCAQSKRHLPAIRESKEREKDLDTETLDIQLKYASASTPNLTSKRKSKKIPETTPEKSKTRPEHLPPKTPAEERRHMNEFNQLIAHAKAQEKVASEKAAERAQKREQQRQSDARIWEKSVRKNAKISRTLWWRGVPESLREQVWVGAIGTSDCPGLEACASSALLAASADVFPSCGLFGPGRPLNSSITSIVSTVARIRHIALDQASSLLHPAAILCLAMDEQRALQCLLGLIPENGLVHAVLVHNEAVSQAHYTAYYKVFRAKFPHLYTHFTTISLAPQHYLDSLVSSFMLAPLDIESASRVMDLIVSEGESFLLRTALGFVSLHELKLYQSRQEAIEQLLAPVQIPEDELIAAIKAISR